MSKLSGTSVIKLSTFLDSLKDMAGTCFLTRLDYDNNPNKVCSFSHINNNFAITWNNCLELVNLPVKRKWKFPIKQGRKPKDKSMAKMVECLRCLNMFESLDSRINRICRKCKDLEDQEE